MVLGMTKVPMRSVTQVKRQKKQGKEKDYVRYVANFIQRFSFLFFFVI